MLEDQLHGEACVRSVSSREIHIHHWTDYHIIVIHRLFLQGISNGCCIR